MKAGSAPPLLISRTSRRRDLVITAILEMGEPLLWERFQATGLFPYAFTQLPPGTFQTTFHRKPGADKAEESPGVCCVGSPNFGALGSSL
jgi:hypothetical protein